MSLTDGKKLNFLVTWACSACLLPLLQAEYYSSLAKLDLLPYKEKQLLDVCESFLKQTVKSDALFSDMKR